MAFSFTVLSLLLVLIQHAATLGTVNKPTGRASSTQKTNKYATHWENLLVAEHQEAVANLNIRKKTWSRSRLEKSGLSIFGASAEPESDLFGDKICKIYKNGDTAARFRDRFAPGEMLVMTPVGRATSAVVPRECIIVDVDKDWLTVGVGPSWPAGLWEARRMPGSYQVRLDRTAPQAPLRAQKSCLELIRRRKAGEAAALMAELFDSADSGSDDLASKVPSRFLRGVQVDGDSSKKTIDEAISVALEKACKSQSFQPNSGQKEAIAWALKRQLSLVRGPPGTGKTRVAAALLVKTALALCSIDDKSKETVAPRILAVAHSNGAADVLLQALLQMGVPAIRVGRPASVSSSVRHRTVVAMAERHPEIVSLRQKARDLSLESHVRYAAATQIPQCVAQVQQAIARTAPVVVTSCIGAYQLLDLESSDKVTFPLVVLDEASQSTEPALLCALAAARAEQVVLVGDTRQLPPTVASEAPELREKLGVSPMARLEKLGVEQKTLRLQYRMDPGLLEHPSQYFYGGLVSCAEGLLLTKNSPPKGFLWPGSDPLAFIQVGSDLEVAHDFGGRSNPTEAELVADVVSGLLTAGDIESRNIAVISPYSKQVQRIHAALSTRSRSLNSDIQIGTVDSFQGQETDVVVFSAVRSNPIGEMGFLRDPRRLCVAITRARRGLIILGDQTVLKTCRHWASLLESCQKRGCIVNAEKLQK